MEKGCPAYEQGSRYGTNDYVVKMTKNNTEFKDESDLG
jgi:hypothetical protein